MRKICVVGIAVFLLLLAACANREAPAEAFATETPEISISAPEATEETLPEPEETVPAVPEQTREPEEGTKVDLTATQQYAANLSLSNFSEQWFCQMPPKDYYDADDATVAQLFQFARLWAKINRPSAIEYVDGYETMTLETFYEITAPRLDVTEHLVPQEGDDYSAELGMGNFDWDRCWYENGRFYYPAADGESYNRFTVVDEAYKINDRTYRFRFTIYELELDLYWDWGGIPAEYYHLTPEEVAARAEITALEKGSAVCTPVYWERSGKEMYMLSRYELDPGE